MISPFVLHVLKYVFLALVYFFVFRAIRSMASEIRGTSRRDRAGARAPKTKQMRPARAGRGKQPTTLVVRAEDGKRLAKHDLSGTLQLGRADACHVKLDDRYASQFHARIYPRDGAWFVEDLGSTNGTYLNRERLSGSAEVHAGDEIRIGRTTLELRR